MASQQVVRVYPSPTSFQVEAARVAAYGWAVATTAERQPPTSCLRVLGLGIVGALVFRPKPELVVTYRREMTGDGRDVQAVDVFGPAAPSPATAEVFGSVIVAAVAGVLAVLLSAVPEIVQYAVTGVDLPNELAGVNLAPWVNLVTFGAVAALVFQRRRAWERDPDGGGWRADLRSRGFRRVAGLFAVWSVCLWAAFNLFASL